MIRAGGDNEHVDTITDGSLPTLFYAEEASSDLLDIRENLLATLLDETPAARDQDLADLAKASAELAEDVTLEEIATRLFVTRNTVKSQVRSVYRKIGASTRVEAVAWAKANGLR